MLAAVEQTEALKRKFPGSAQKQSKVKAKAKAQVGNKAKANGGVKTLPKKAQDFPTLCQGEP